VTLELKFSSFENLQNNQNSVVIADH